MENIRDEYDGDLPLDRMAGDLAGHLTEGMVAANFHGMERENANGLSIYFPKNRYSPYYDKQAFADSGWNRVIRLTMD